MSTYFYLVCDDCKQSIGIARIGGASFLGPLDDQQVLPAPFAIVHEGHHLTVVSEGHPKSWEYREWMPEQVHDLIKTNELTSDCQLEIEPKEPE